MPLTDLSDFRSQAGNWQIVGDVTMNRNVDVHELAQPALEDKRKKKKKSKVGPVVERPKAVIFQSGNGILLNINDDTKKDHLVTIWEHGDMDLEFEVMLPKGSNSGIYLQGRYEVQLLDSWGVRNPKFSDIGGIYRNWETQPGNIYMGKAPLSNPAKAPGLWQKMEIAFRAPKFDAKGNKIANARFASVKLNGVTIHDNVEVPLPTGGPIEKNEKPFGPLMIQGDHGAVAFRNIKYKLLKDIDVEIQNIAYKIYLGKFKTIEDYAGLKPVASGTSTELTCEILNTEDAYGTIYTGEIVIPMDATYEFTLGYTGGVKFMINNNTLIDVQRADAWDGTRASIALKTGTYAFEICNYKDASWAPPRLGLSVQTANSYLKRLNAYNSYPSDDDIPTPILINPGPEPRLLRAFVDFKVDRSQRLTHTIGVGDPSGVNYVYDLKSGNLVCAWRGDFVNATPMWHDRGDGSFRPMGAVQFFFTEQPLAFLDDQSKPFPASGSNTEFRGKGYVIDETTARPIFKYLYEGLEVESRIYPDDNNRIVTHEISIKNRAGQTNLFYKLGEGKNIIPLADGSYAIDDKQYYVNVHGSQPMIREVNDKKELVLQVNSDTIKYSVIW
ncbi:MAG: family 16 glycoside hydrolase [Bacteroidota bacterium]